MGGWGVLVLAGERGAGLSAIERALALNPNSALAWNFFGWAQAYHNRFSPAAEALQRAVRLSPLDPQRWMFDGGLAHAHLAAGRHEAAIEAADRALHAQPRAIAMLKIKAAACGNLGRVEEGSKCVRRVLELGPWSTIASSREMTRLIFSPEVLAIYIGGLRKAGLPEE